ncbi:MAG: hypothetical protein HRT36_06190 [Alphaproteobacteria bacterium]|nr:hypothetical protein [Alphaproteobacteria bacterium]
MQCSRRKQYKTIAEDWLCSAQWLSCLGLSPHLPHEPWQQHTATLSCQPSSRIFPTIPFGNARSAKPLRTASHS